MNGLSGFHQRTLANLFFALGDGLLAIGGFFLAGFLRFSNGISGIWEIENWGVKVVFFLIVVQTVFYYFDLYEPKNIRQRIKMAIRLGQAIAVSSILLAILSYFIHPLALERGILVISLVLIFPAAFLWRFFYAWVGKVSIFKERILIVGSDLLARNISNEISENWRDAFEIVGFVDEPSEKIGKAV